MRGLGVLLILVLGACSSPAAPTISTITSAPTTSTTTSTAPTTTTTLGVLVSGECDAAFAAAAAVGEMEDTVADLYPAVLACHSLSQWTAASDAHPDALDGTDPAIFLGNLCAYAEDAEVREAPLCDEVS